jgi:hypothetical protein
MTPRTASLTDAVARYQDLTASADDKFRATVNPTRSPNLAGKYAPDSGTTVLWSG